MSDHTKGVLETVGARYLWITGEHGAAVAIIAEPQCNNSSDIRPVNLNSERWDEAMANAAELVHRWNSYPAMLEALEAAIPALEASEACLKSWNGTGSWVDVERILVRGRAALAQARGKGEA